MKVDVEVREHRASPPSLDARRTFAPKIDKMSGRRWALSTPGPPHITTASENEENRRVF